jgi:hypothetical protein
MYRNRVITVNDSIIFHQTRVMTNGAQQARGTVMR